MIITVLSHKKIKHPDRVAAPDFVRTLPVRLFGRAALRGTALVRGIHFHRAVAGFLPDGRLPAAARPFYPFLNALRRDLRGRGYKRFTAEVDIEQAGMIGRADIVAVGRFSRAVLEVKTCSALPEAPEAAHVAQAALYASTMPGASVLVAYVCIASATVRIFEWATMPLDVHELQTAA